MADRTITWDAEVQDNQYRHLSTKFFEYPVIFYNFWLKTLKGLIFMSLPGLNNFRCFSKPRVLNENPFNLTYVKAPSPSTCVPPPIFFQ